MKRYLLAFLLIVSAIGLREELRAQVIQPGMTSPVGCSVVHKDAAVNTTVTVATPSPTNRDQSVYICGWDFQVVANGTGTAQTNVLWTTTNLGGYAVEYSTGAVANSITTGTFQYTRPLKAQTEGAAVLFISPAAAAQSAYSVNVYYYFAP